MQYFIYILYSVKIDKYYVGYTTDLDNRLSEHNRGKTSFSKSGMPWIRVYFETFETKSEALKREKYIKSQKSAKFIKALIAN